MTRYSCYCTRWCVRLFRSRSIRPDPNRLLVLSRFRPPKQPSQFPVVPTRMYPAPPPSRLPGLLVGTFKMLSWLAGGSTALLFIYYVRKKPAHPLSLKSVPAADASHAPLGHPIIIAIRASPPYAIGARPSLAQGAPRRSPRQARGLVARLQGGAKGRVRRFAPS